MTQYLLKLLLYINNILSQYAFTEFAYIIDTDKYIRVEKTSIHGDNNKNFKELSFKTSPLFCQPTIVCWKIVFGDSTLKERDSTRLTTLKNCLRPIYGTSDVRLSNIFPWKISFCFCQFPKIMRQSQWSLINLGIYFLYIIILIAPIKRTIFSWKSKSSYNVFDNFVM